MSNVYALPKPVSPRPPRELTNNERDQLTRGIQKIAADQYYPLSRLLMRLAVVVRDYPLEEVTLKDLAPKGYMLSVDYPVYGLHWVFRLEGEPGPMRGTPVTDLDLLASLQKGAQALGSSQYGVRFCNRFLNDLGETARVESITHDSQVMVVAGCIQATPFALNGKYQHLPFRMILSRL